jgi:hypothetical protein
MQGYSWWPGELGEIAHDGRVNNAGLLLAEGELQYVCSS